MNFAPRRRNGGGAPIFSSPVNGRARARRSHVMQPRRIVLPWFQRPAAPPDRAPPSSCRGPRRCQRHLVPCRRSAGTASAKVQRLLLVEEPILEAPELRAVGLDPEMEALRIAQGPGLLSRPGGIDLDVSQHGRFPSKAGSIREHQKEQHFVATAGALSRISPDGVWRFSVKECCETSRLLDLPGRCQSQSWCQKRTRIHPKTGLFISHFNSISRTRPPSGPPV
jgi:hypothetical protein